VAADPRTFDTPAAGKGNPVANAILQLEQNPRRPQRAMPCLKLALADWLATKDFESACVQKAQEAKAHMTGKLRYKDLYPIVVDLLGAANMDAALLPELTLDMPTYEKMVQKFTGAQADACNVRINHEDDFVHLPRFVVAMLHLDQVNSPDEDPFQFIDVEREMQRRLDMHGGKAGDPQISLMWDTEDDFDLCVSLPDDLGVICATDRDLEGGVLDVDTNADATEATATDAVKNIFFPEYNANDPGQLLAPDGEYEVKLKMNSRRSTAPCHWRVRVRTAGKARFFSGTFTVQASDENFHKQAKFPVTTFEFDPTH